MTLTRKLASALCLVLSFSNSSDAQTVDPSTGNLINFTGSPTATTSNWYNAGSVGQPLTCWSAGDPGYCGPNPRVSAWGPGSNVINYSYGTTNLSQIVNINNALAASGTGIQVTGFNFGFTAKNGNGWDGGSQDYLSAYVNLYNAAGGLAANYNYTQYTNRKYGWTTFNFNETFSTPYKASALSTAQVGFVGRDNNYWVGPYGPEIIDVNFSLKYTTKPDPCVSDPLSSATCPGYATAYAKTMILGSTVSNASAPAAPPPPSGPSGPGAESGNAGPPQPNGAGPGPGADMMGPGGPGPGGGPSNNSGQSAGQPGGAGNRVGGNGGNGGSSGPSLTSVLGMISTNQAKIANTEKSVVQAAESQAVQAGQQAQQQAESVAGSLAAQSIAGSLAQSAGMNGPLMPGAQSQISTAGPGVGSTPGMVSNGTGLRLLPTTQFDNSLTNSNTVFQSSSETYGLQAPQQFNTTQSIPEIPQSEGFKPGSLSVLSDAMEQRPMTFASPGTESRTETVKRDIPANDLARGIDIAAMALQPQGYAQYSVVMADVPFYAPKEIYKNQNTVDNVRVLRQLSNDRLHQQLVESQYKQGE